ncbi:class I SAM-dependent methyltransferase [Candidatus Pelagibacter sp.]|uniref:class I SAM-dependent methyltransferase n=1 Tax=Candidatus Pelagibacter sp. TaxID=2024849 RepID=UPI00010BC3A8
MKLHIGGKEIKEGWKILNIQKNEGVDFVGSITDLSQFEDESIDEIYASHVVEHVDQNNIKKTLSGINRVLKKNGKFYISVPDLDILCRIFIEKTAPLKVKFHVMRMMFGGQIDDFDYHYFGWNYEFLNSYLVETGFTKNERVKTFDIFNDTSSFAPYGPLISLNVIAYK